MKLALIGDIHSNYRALEICIAHSKKIGVDGFIFLGDYISDCPYPQKTLKLIRELESEYKTWFLRGNREDYQIDYHYEKSNLWKDSSSSGSLLHTYENLTVEDLEFFKSCPIKMKISIEGMPEFIVCHGSPNSTREGLLAGNILTEKYLKECESNILICAHTHIQCIYKSQGKILINPGAVGLPAYSDGKTQFAILHDVNGKWEPEFFSLDYDVDSFIEEYKNSELMNKANVYAKAILKELKTGDDYMYPMLNKAKELAVESEGYVNHYDIPEKYWEEAYDIVCKTKDNI